MKYIVTYGKKGDRRFVLKNGKILKFNKKDIAKKYLKKCKGKNPRIAKLKW